MKALTDKQVLARHSAYEEAIAHCRDAAGSDRDFLLPHEAEELLALANRLEAELNRMCNRPKFNDALCRAAAKL